MKAGVKAAEKLTACDERTVTAQELPAQLFTVNQIARQALVCERTIRRRIADGTLPVVRLGRAVRITAAVRKRILEDGLS